MESCLYPSWPIVEHLSVLLKSLAKVIPIPDCLIAFHRPSQRSLVDVHSRFLFPLIVHPRALSGLCWVASHGSRIPLAYRIRR